MADTDVYFRSIAQARYVIRKVMRIADDAAKKHDLEPLQHQALLQIRGSSSGQIQPAELAARLDIVPAFASRLVKELERRELIVRSPSDVDRRVVLIEATQAGRDLLDEIDQHVRREVHHFQGGLGSDEREAALSIFEFYVGTDS